MTEREDRPCHSHSEHVGHPWDGGRRWCKGSGRYADDARPVRPEAAEECGHRYEGISGRTLWVCRGPAGHPVPEGHQGYAGAGHTMVSVPRAAAS